MMAGIQMEPNYLQERGGRDHERKKEQHLDEFLAGRERHRACELVNELGHGSPAYCRRGDEAEK